MSKTMKKNTQLKICWVIYNVKAYYYIFIITYPPFQRETNHHLNQNRHQTMLKL